MGNVTKYNSMCIVKRYMQSYGIYYYLIHAPVPLMSTLRVVLSSAVKLKVKVHQIEESSAFLNSFLDDTFFFKQPPG